MASVVEQARREKAYRQLFGESLGRLRKKGLSEQEAERIAKEVADESLRRLETPVYHTQQQFSDAVRRVCTRLSEGASYYALIGEMPFLATARIDRIVAVAPRTDPPVDPDTTGAAQRAIRVERLSASTALLFTSLALGRLGLWWAIGVGMIIALLTEIYVELLLPARVRLAVADMYAPFVINVAAIIGLLYFGYRWLVDTTPPALVILAAAVAFGVIAFVVPAVTVGRLVRTRERRHRKALEEKLLGTCRRPT